MPRSLTAVSLLLLLTPGPLPQFAYALDDSVPGVYGDVSRQLLGDGTGVIIGIVDSGVDDTHPAFAGNDSQGNSRLVAEANFVPTEPANTGDDVVGHGTWVASAALGRDDRYAGMATDARFVNGRVLNSTNGFNSGSWVQNGYGFAIDNGADVINLSLNFSAPNSSGTQSLDLMIDWAAGQGVHTAVCAGNISTGNGSPLVRSPGSAYNGVTVGRTDSNFDQVHSDSATAFTSDGRMKPDLVAPGTALTLANDDWEGVGQPLFDTGRSGCSFATPHVAGMMAQQIEAGRSRGLDTSPLVVKTTLMNSADHGVLSKGGGAWTPADAQINEDVFTTTLPLDISSGAGQIDGLALSKQYLAGEQSPGDVLGIGWDLNDVDVGEAIDYVISEPITAGDVLTTTLSWLRHVVRFDSNGNGQTDSGDFFSTLNREVSNLDLEILLGGTKIAESTSSAGNLEHLQLVAPMDGEYTIRVRGISSQDDVTETFSIAWFASNSNPFLTADFNLDGGVDGEDFLIWQAGFGITSGATLVDGDADEDGDVDGSDFLAWQANFGAAAGRSIGPTAIPEPTSAGLFVLAAAILFFVRTK